MPSCQNRRSYNRLIKHNGGEFYHSLLFFIKKFIAFSLLITLTACGNSTETANKTPENQAVEMENTTKAEEIMPDLPDVNMEGKSFTFLTCNWPGEAVWTMADIMVDELTGETLNDAKYNRNVTIETKYNCKINEKIWILPATL